MNTTNSPLEYLAAFVITFVTGAVATMALVKYIETIKKKGVCTSSDHAPISREPPSVFAKDAANRLNFDCAVQLCKQITAKAQEIPELQSS